VVMELGVSHGDTSATMRNIEETIVTGQNGRYYNDEDDSSKLTSPMDGQNEHHWPVTMMEKNALYHDLCRWRGQHGRPTHWKMPGYR